MTNLYGVQNNVQTAVTVDGNVIEPRQLICHTEMIQSSFIYRVSVTITIFSRHFTETQTFTARNLERDPGPSCWWQQKRRRRRGAEAGMGWRGTERHADISSPLGKFQSCLKLLEDKLLSLSSVWRRGRSGLSIHGWEFVKCPPLQIS